MTNKVLVTGASGFIGTHTIAEAYHRGLGVVAFDRYNIPGQFPYDVERFVGDIRDYEAVQEAVNKVDYVVNLAGILGTQETIPINTNEYSWNIECSGSYGAQRFPRGPRRTDWCRQLLDEQFILHY